jgi:hypothetical protein
VELERRPRVEREKKEKEKEEEEEEDTQSESGKGRGSLIGRFGRGQVGNGRSDNHQPGRGQKLFCTNAG